MVNVVERGGITRKYTVTLASKQVSKAKPVSCQGKQRYEKWKEFFKLWFWFSSKTKLWLSIPRLPFTIPLPLLLLISKMNHIRLRDMVPQLSRIVLEATQVSYAKYKKNDYLKNDFHFFRFRLGDLFTQYLVHHFGCGHQHVLPFCTQFRFNQRHGDVSVSLWRLRWVSNYHYRKKWNYTLLPMW